MSKFKAKKFSDKHFIVEITTSALCNMDCSYCFEGEKVDKQKLNGNSDQLIKSIYEILDSEWYKNEWDALKLSFWGGEPTLNNDLIKIIAEEFNQHEEILFHIYTNGYDRRRLKNVVDWCGIDNISVQISWDGNEMTDIFRTLKTGKGTSKKVLDNIYYFSDLGVNLSIKSTIGLTSSSMILKSWLDFEEIFNKLADNKNTYVSYSPTIDYINTIPSDERAVAYEDFQDIWTQVARYEVEFYKKHNRFLCSWFGSGDHRQTCSAGGNMLAIDVDGNSYACHGALYSDNKTDLLISNIDDANFAELSGKYSEGIRDVLKTDHINKACIDCVATVCIICPVASYDLSGANDFNGKWTDRWVTDMCGFYKGFGKVDRSVQRIVDYGMSSRN
jgi:radical SAM protein with 4Fe4S-binding SPASM domain